MTRRILLLLAIVGSLTLSLGRPGRAEDLGRPLTQDELFDGSRLIEIRVDVAEPDWQALRVQSYNFATAFGKDALPEAYTWFPGDLTIDGRKLSGVRVRKKGFFGSADQTRPSLKVRIDQKDQVRLLAGLDKLTINNNKQDKAFVSQYLGYRLFQAAGLPAPRCCLATLTVNGKSLGVYAHVESIDQPFLRRVFGNDNGALYEGVFPSDFFADRIDRFDGKKTGKRGSDRSDLRQIAEILEKPGDNYVARLAEIIDLDQFITYWALESLIGFWDGYAANQNNYFVYKNPADSKWHFIPWGADMTFVPPFFPSGGKKSVYAKGQLAFQLNQDPEIRQKYQQTMLRLLDTVWHEEPLLAEVDRIQSLVKDHLHPAQRDLDKSAETARNFIKKRRAEILDETKEGPVHVTAVPRKPFYMREAGKVTATFATVWTPKDAKDPAERRPATWELDLNGESVKLDEVVALSRPSQFGGFGGPPGPLPPTVALSGVRESDNKKLTLTVTFTTSQFQANNNEPVTVQGSLTEGNGFGFGPGMKTFNGKAQLKSAGLEAGAAVEGTLSGTLFEMRGQFGGP